MANRKNNPSNQFVKKLGVDLQPWNRSRMQVEPSEDSPTAAPEPRGRYSDRIKISPTEESGAATPRTVRNWPEGLKKI